MVVIRRFSWISAVVAFVAGCDVSDIGLSVAEHYDVQHPQVWMVPDGKQVIIGDETVSIIGTDTCSTGFGDTYSCWLFSLTPGDSQLVTLSNGLREIWTTKDAGESRVYLVRPNGIKVIAK